MHTVIGSRYQYQAPARSSSSTSTSTTRVGGGIANCHHQRCDPTACFRYKCDPIRLVITDAIAAAQLAAGVWSKSAGRETLRVPATLCCVFPEGTLCCHVHRASHISSPRYSCRCVHPSDPDRACEAQLCVPAAFPFWRVPV